MCGMWQGATYISRQHYRLSSLGCAFHGNDLIFTKPGELLSLQHAWKPKKSTVLKMVTTGGPWQEMTNTAESSLTWSPTALKNACRFWVAAGRQ